MKPQNTSTTVALLFAACLTANAVTFEHWRESFFATAQLADPTISGADADPDGDSVRNFSEYALRTDPWTPNGEPILTPGFTLDLTTSLYHFSATFRVTGDFEGTLIVPQVSDTLGTRWRADEVAPRGIGYTADGRYEFLAFDKKPYSQLDRRFLRLLIASDADDDGLPDDWELSIGLSPSDPFDSMADTDEDGDSSLTEFLHGTDPLDPKDNSRRDDPPRAPRNVSIVFSPEGNRSVVWEDASDNEQFFVIFGTDAAGNQVELGRVGPNQPRFDLPAGF